MSEEVYDLGVRLRQLRKAKGLSQEETARRLSMSRSTIANYEANTSTPSIEVLKTLALFYRVSTDYLLGLERHKTISVTGFSDAKFHAALTIIHTLGNLQDES